MIEAHGLTKRYGSTLAVDDLSFEVLEGRDELKADGMWNSNSVISWILESAHISEAAGAPPRNGTAPGWNAGLVVAQRQPPTGAGRNSSVGQDRS